MGGGRKEERGGDIEERQRVLRHASSLNRADVIKKVVCRSLSVSGAATPPISGNGKDDTPGGDADVDKEVLNHVDEEGMTALHYAVRKSSLDVSTLSCSVTTINRPYTSGCRNENITARVYGGSNVRQPVGKALCSWLAMRSSVSANTWRLRFSCLA